MSSSRPVALDLGGTPGCSWRWRVSRCLSDVADLEKEGFGVGDY